MLDLASATRIHNRSEMSHQPLDGHDLLPTLRRKDHLPPDNLPAIGFSCVAPASAPHQSAYSRWVEDLHLQAVDHARHTQKRPPGAAEYEQVSDGDRSVCSAIP